MYMNITMIQSKKFFGYVSLFVCLCVVLSFIGIYTMYMRLWDDLTVNAVKELKLRL